MGHYYRVGDAQTLPEVVADACPLLSLEAVRNHKKNQPLIAARGDYGLRGGDEVWIPEQDAEVTWFRVESGSKLTLQIDAGARPFALRLHDAKGKRLRTVPYQLDIDGVGFKGTTDEEGLLELELPVSATRGTLRVKHTTREIVIGGLDPLHTAKGIQARLTNLGYWPGPIDGVFGPKTTRAIRAFQKERGLKVDGIAGPKTRDALKEAYGC